MKIQKNSVLFAIALLVLIALAGSVQAQQPDLNVTSITINPGETRGEGIVRVYVNESNNISAVVYNNGSASAGAFDVCFDADGVKIGCVEVASLAAGANTTVSIGWTPTCADYSVMPGFPAQSLPVTINVTADCNCTDCPTCPVGGSNGKIAESYETNNMLSKFIPAIQGYSTYDVIAGVVNNGYKSKNFDCNTTEEPLTLFEYDDMYGGIAYNVSGAKISTFQPTNTSTRNHSITIPSGMTVKKARLYVYWYDKWGNYKTYPTGCRANLSVNFSGTEFTPDVKYNDQKGFGYYHSPKGTYAYNVTSKVIGSGDYTAIVKNIDPANSTTLLGEMLLVVYEDPSQEPGNKIQLWILEGNDYLMAADETHGSHNFGVSPEEATATVTFPGSIDPAKVINATLVTVVAQGMASRSNMLFNGNVIKTDAWDSPTEAYPNSKINVESMNVTSNLTSSGNNMGFLDNGTGGMQASNAILVVEYDTEKPVINSISLSPTTVTARASITVTVNATDNVEVTKVTADEIALTQQDSGDIWIGTITAASTSGSHAVIVIAYDAAGNNATDRSKSYTVIARRVGGGGIPRDSDSDGISDIDEMLAGTDKNDPCDPNPECAACLAIRPPTPTPTPTPLVVALTPTPTLPPVATPTPTPAPSPTPKPGIPGFEAVFVIAGLLAVAYLVLRKKRK